MKLLLLALLVLALVPACTVEHRMPPGYQGIVEHDERHLGFQVGGKIETIHVRRGDALDKGSPIAVLDDSAEIPVLRAREADLAQAKAKAALVYAGPREEEVRATMAELDGARAELRDVKSNLDRNLALPEEAATAASLMSDLRAAHASARARVRMLEQQLKQLRKGARPEELAAADAAVRAAEAAVAAEEEHLALFSMESVSHVTVLDVPVREGEVVAAGATVVKVADTTHPYVDVFVPQQDLSGLAVGTSAQIRVDAESDTFDGRIEHVAPTTEFTPRYLFSPRERSNLVVRVRVRIDDPEERLHAGVPAFATFARKED